MLADCVNQRRFVNKPCVCVSVCLCVMLTSQMYPAESLHFSVVGGVCASESVCMCVCALAYNNTTACLCHLLLCCVIIYWFLFLQPKQWRRLIAYIACNCWRTATSLHCSRLLDRFLCTNLTTQWNWKFLIWSNPSHQPCLLEIKFN